MSLPFLIFLAFCILLAIWALAGWQAALIMLVLETLYVAFMVLKPEESK